jgi:hypothetical protein
MILKGWFYREGHPNRVAALYAQSRREFGRLEQ